jgi:RNA polymerase sigma-70 factor (ECF subfamily)
LSIDELGAMFGCHRATAARRIADARQELVHRVHAALRSRLRLEHRDLQSVMRLIDSQLNLSVGGLLACPEPT